MNKRMFLWVMLAAFSFAGCTSDDDVENNDNGSPDNPPQGTLLVEGRHWCVGICELWPVLGEVSAYTDVWIEGSIEYNGKTYKRLKYRYGGDGFSEEETKVVRELKPMREEGGKVFVLDTSTGKETLDFDCNAKVGDLDPQGYAITEIANKVVGVDNAIERKCFMMQLEDDLSGEPPYMREYIEGIGYVDGAFLHDPLTTGAFYKLLCCHEADGKCIYGQAGHTCYINND